MDNPDFDRWRNLDNFLLEWDQRAEIASRWIPPGTTVLDIGCGRMSLERYLAAGCKYVPCDLFPRDERTLICNLNTDPIPAVQGVNVISALGVTEYLTDPAAFYRGVRQFGVPFINSYHPVLERHPLDRKANGWVNALTFSDWFLIADESGFRVQELTSVSAVQYLIAFEPD